VEMPIVEAVNAVVNQGADPRQEVMKLMCREQRPEQKSRRNPPGFRRKTGRKNFIWHRFVKNKFFFVKNDSTTHLGKISKKEKRIYRICYLI